MTKSWCSSAAFTTCAPRGTGSRPPLMHTGTHNATQRRCGLQQARGQRPACIALALVRMHAVMVVPNKLPQSTQQLPNKIKAHLLGVVSPRQRALAAHLRQQQQPAALGQPNLRSRKRC